MKNMQSVEREALSSPPPPKKKEVKKGIPNRRWCPQCFHNRGGISPLHGDGEALPQVVCANYISYWFLAMYCYDYVPYS